MVNLVEILTFRRKEMTDKIGTSAGVIWSHLNNNGQMTISALQKGTKLNKAALDMGIGWLAREDKIKIEGGRVKKICLID